MEKKESLQAGDKVCFWFFSLWIFSNKQNSPLEILTQHCIYQNLETIYWVNHELFSQAVYAAQSHNGGINAGPLMKVPWERTSTRYNNLVSIS